VGFEMAFESLQGMTDLMSAGTEFQVCGAATENARQASSVHTLSTVSSVASHNHRGRSVSCCHAFLAPVQNMCV